MGILRAWPCVLLCGCAARLDGDTPRAEPDAGVVDIDAAIDAAPDAAPGMPMPRMWTTPTLIPGVNDAAFADDDPSMTADRLAIVFTSNRGGNYDLYIGRRASTSNPFTVTALTALNSTAGDISPEISADGNTLHFVSKRSGTAAIYRSTYNGTTWSAPAAVTALASLTGDNVAISPDGLTLLAISPQAATNYVMRSVRASTSVAWPTPERVATLEVTTDVAAPTLTNAGGYVYLHAGVPRDIYVSVNFGTPTKVDALSSTGRDSGPSVDALNGHIVFSRDGELYESTR